MYIDCVGKILYLEQLHHQSYYFVIQFNFFLLKCKSFIYISNLIAEKK